MTHQHSDNSLPAGKLPPDLLTSLLAGLTGNREVVVGAAFGEDAAVVSLGDRYLVVTLDPVTMSSHPGRIVVQINANDIAVMGARPLWLLAAILLPPGSGEAAAREVVDELRGCCSDLGVSLIGGHTEISPSVTRPIVVGCMIGDVAKEQLVTSSGARVGDRILLAGPIAVEGTGILAREYSDVLAARGVAREVIEEGAALLDDPGISVLPAVRALQSVATPHAMHDPTEGGLLTALREIAGASHKGLALEVERVPVLPSCRAICRALGLDPLGLLASGSLLAAIAPEDVEAATRALREAGIESAVIGTVLPESEGLFIVVAGGRRLLPEFERDELARFVEGLAETPS